MLRRKTVMRTLRDKDLGSASLSDGCVVAAGPPVADDRRRKWGTWLAGEGGGYDIFVSYSRLDRERVACIVEALEAAGWRVFWDFDIPPGWTWDEFIGTRLDKATVVLAVWSTDSVRSEFVRAEASRARRRRALVPVLIDPVEPPVEFERLQATDLTAWVSAGEAELLPTPLQIELARRMAEARRPAAEGPGEASEPARLTQVFHHGAAARPGRSPLRRIRPGWLAAALLLGLGLGGVGAWLGLPSFDNSPAAARLRTEVGELRTQLLMVENDLRHANDAKVEADRKTEKIQSAFDKKERVLPPPNTAQMHRDCEDCPLLVRLPPGDFMMGAADNEGDDDKVMRQLDTARPRVAIRIDHELWMSAYPITVGEFKSFLQASRSKGSITGDDSSPMHRATRFEQQDNHPVVDVSWNEAQEYVAWLSARTGKRYRLPSEAEWEYAARAGTTTSRYWGDGWDGANRNVNQSTSGTAPLLEWTPNKFGLVAMLGHVMHWTEDCWGDLKGYPADGLPRPRGDCDRRSVRGGSWNDSPKFIRAAYRESLQPTKHDGYHGFRVVRVD